MKPILRKIFLWAAAAVLLFGAAGLWLSDHYVVPVLMYHHIALNPEHRDDTVTPANFLKQMTYLKRHGYHVLSMRAFIAGKCRGERFLHKSVVLTFDDGNEDNWTNAVPVLREFGFPATMLLPTGLIGEKGRLTWAQVEAMQRDGVGFGAHTVHHSYLPGLDARQQIAEITESKKMLERRLGRPVEVFCYPVGGFNRQIEREVRQAGYKAALATNRGFGRFNRDLYAIDRIKMTDKSTPPAMMAVKLSGYYNLFRTPKNPD